MMSRAKHHFVRVGSLLSLFFLILALAQFHISKSKNDVALQKMLSTIKRTPIKDVESTYQELSKAAPRSFYAGIESNFESIKTNDRLLEDQVRLAIILSPNRPKLRSILKERLIKASPDEIETLRRLSLDVESTADGPNDQWRQRLSKSINASPLIDGVQYLWPVAPDSLNDSISKYEGKMTTRFAWCSSMPLAKFQELSAGLRSALGQWRQRTARSRYLASRRCGLEDYIWTLSRRICGDEGS